jgi:hypothetical protein
MVISTNPRFITSNDGGDEVVVFGLFLKLGPNSNNNVSFGHCSATWAQISLQ